MIKGCQREMIVMQTGESALFESAYFILRRDKRTCQKDDMLAEANRIIGAGNDYLTRRTKRPARRVWFFLGGVLCGAGTLALLMLVFGVLGT